MSEGNVITVKARNYRIDNIRFILMLLVIFAHGLELFGGGARDVIYKIVYSFHMPAFLFLMGYFAKFRIKKFITDFVVAYLGYQVVYIMFDRYVLGNADTALQFTRPYWLLWYLMAAAFCLLLTPIFSKMNAVAAGICIPVLTAAALIIGYFPKVGYFLSLSRFFVFLPFFAMGFFARKFKWVEKLHESKGKIWMGIVSAAGAAAGIAYLIVFSVPEKFLYGSFSYSAQGCAIYDRAIIMLTACCWIVILLLCVSEKKIPVVSILGSSTFIPYIFHGFAIRLAEKHNLLSFSEGVNLVLAFAAAVVLYLCLGYIDVGIGEIKGKIKKMKENKTAKAA